MTKKDYELIASVIKDFGGGGVGEVKAHSGYPNATNLAEALAYMFAMTNARFDRNKFLQACGIEQKS